MHNLHLFESCLRKTTGQLFKEFTEPFGEKNKLREKKIDICDFGFVDRYLQ